MLFFGPPPAAGLGFAAEADPNDPRDDAQRSSNPPALFAAVEAAAAEGGALVLEE